MLQTWTYVGGKLVVNNHSLNKVTKILALINQKQPTNKGTYLRTLLNMKDPFEQF